MALYQLDDHVPQLAPGAWVADSASVIGRAHLGENASVWYGAVLRADNDVIRIGRNTNVQDGCVLHVDPGFPLTLDDEVTVGHQAMLHGCHVGQGSLVGIQAVVMNGAKIGRHCIIGAGAVVTEGKEFPDGSLIVGAPAKLVRPLSAEQVESVKRMAVRYVAQSQHHFAGVRRVG